MPKTYESQAIFEIISNESSQNTPHFSFETELARIKDRESLGKVVDKLELANKWKWGVDKKTAIQIIQSITITENIRGTDLISIRVRHNNKEDARDIAHGVMRAYESSRMEEQEGEFDRRYLESLPKIHQPSKEDVQFCRMPDDVIIVHEEPQIAQNPVWPNISLILTLGAVGGFLLSPLLSLPVILLLNELNRAKEGRTSADVG